MSEFQSESGDTENHCEDVIVPWHRVVDITWIEPCRVD